MTEYYLDTDFKDFVQTLISSNQLEDIEVGISKRFLDKGYETLSVKQKNVFNKMVEKYVIRACCRCGIDIPWNEKYDALSNGGYCNYCKNMIEKIQEE